MSRRIAIGIVVLAGILMVTYVVVRPIRGYRNTSTSMEPTLENGQYIFAVRSSDAHIGDVIVFDYPVQPSTQFLKRVVAVGGDTVEIHAKKLYRNGHEVSEPYILHDDPTTYPSSDALPEPYRSRDNFGPYTVPANSYFVLGDNRDRSSDSRYWGPVPRKNLYGRVLGVH